MKPLIWMGDSKKCLLAFPADARHDTGYELGNIQHGGQASDFKSMPSIGKGVEDTNMGGVRNVSSDLRSEVRRGGIRAARVSKKDAADQPKRSRVSAQAIRKAGRRANVVSLGPPYEEFNSIWESLGFPPEESASLNVRASLMREVHRIIEKNEWTQAEAARQCHVSQPRINDLLRGKFHKFSIDALVNMAGALGCDVEVRLIAA